jgi:hypothetical protein
MSAYIYFFKHFFICAILLIRFLFIGRESGIVQKFSLSAGTIVDVHMNEASGVVAATIAVNANSTKMAVIDANSTLRLVDLTQKLQKDEYANFKRSDVWSVLWASDNPDMFVSMEKIKMYIFKGVCFESIRCSVSSSLQWRNYFIDIVRFRTVLLI